MDLEYAIEILKTFKMRQKSRNYNKICLEDVEATEVVLKELDELKSENDTIKSRIHIKIERAEHKLKNNISNFKRTLLKDKVGTLKDVLFEEYYSSEKPHKYSLEHMREQNATLRKELDKKDKVIDEMLKILARNELGHYKGEHGSYERFNKEDWKEYIYKKVEKQE